MEEMGICCDHYIRAIKGGVVTLVPSRDSRGRPAPRIRSLRDIYKSEYARRAGMSENVEVGVPRVDRELHEQFSDDVDCIDLDDDITLEQLRERSLLKKRKRVYGHQNIDLAPVCEKPLEDQSDFDEPLINLKLKAPKRSRAKRKLAGRCDHQSSCSKVPTPVATQPEENVVSEDYMQVSAETAPVKVKLEAYEAGERDCSTTFFADDSSLGHDEGPNGSEPPVQCIEDYGDCVTNGISYDHLDIEPTLKLIPWGGVDVKFEAHEWEDQDILPLAIDYGGETLELCYCKSSHSDDILATESGEETLEACHCRSSHIDDIWAIESGEENLEVCSSRSSHLDGHLDSDPVLMLTWDGVDVNLESSGLEDQDSLDLHPLATESGEETLEVLSCESSHPSNLLANEFGEETTKVHSCMSSQLDIQNPDFCSNSSISCMMSEQSSRPEMDVPDMTTNGLPDEKDQSLVSHDRVCEPSCDLSMSMKIDDTSVVVEDITADEEQASSCTLDGAKGNELNCQNSRMKDEFLGLGAKLTSASLNIGAETDPCIKNHGRAIAETVSSPETCSHPEKLLSKRKIISPCSRERLRLAINLGGRCNDNDQYKCKEKLFEHQTGKKTSPLKSDTLPGKVVINNGGRGHFIQRNGIRQAIKKPNVKGNYDGLRSRAYPKISSSRNSIEGCSESAIEFSQRQMHYMENVAGNLIKELNSMKGIVEEKLLFQAYRNGSLKNNADEAKSAIENATRAEVVARKWLTNMSRDCNRFCKIMKMTPPTSVASKDTVCSGEKKISFADDAGGELCQVKYFVKGENSLMSDVVEQDGRST